MHHKITSQTRTSFWGTTKWGVSGAIICIFCDVLSSRPEFGDVFSSGVYFFGARKQISTLVESNELRLSDSAASHASRSASVRCKISSPNLKLL